MQLFDHVSFFAVSDIGRKRKNNEDACAVFPSYGVWCVADGMGGGDDGEVASRATVQAVQKYVKSHTFPSGRGIPAVVTAVGVSKAVSHVSSWIYQRARERCLNGCGSTFVCLILDATNPSAALALHAGDSRLYRIRGRGIKQITRDHSAVEMLGVKSEKDVNPMFRGMIMRAVGTQEHVDLERTPFDVESGDCILLCSDGLSRMISDKKICSIVGAHQECEETTRALVAAANAAGGVDNITVVLIKLGELPSPSPVADVVVDDTDTSLGNEAETSTETVGNEGDTSESDLVISESTQTLGGSLTSTVPVCEDHDTSIVVSESGDTCIDAVSMAIEELSQTSLSKLGRKASMELPTWRSRCLTILLIVVILVLMAVGAYFALFQRYSIQDVSTHTPGVARASRGDDQFVQTYAPVLELRKEEESQTNGTMSVQERDERGSP